MAKVFSTISKLKKIRESRCRQERSLYPLIFQDDLYGIAYNCFMGESDHRKNKIFGSDNEFNFLTLKRLMRKSRRSNLSWVVSDESVDESQIIREIIIIVFNLIFSFKSETFMEKTNEWNSYQSIHSVFPFMEDRTRSSNSCLDVIIPYSFHPEKSIRIFRRRISDISSIHSPRLFFHRNENLILSDPYTISRRNQFHCFLWNFHTHEFECSLIYIWKQIYQFQSTLFWFYLDRTNLAHKIECISKQLNFRIIENIAKENHSIHYVRYQNNSVITTDENTKLLIGNWKVFLIIFWEKYFRSWFEPYRVSVKNLSKNSLSVLGYILRTKNRSVIIGIQLVNHSIGTDLVTKEFCGIIPLVPSIGLLAREKFCDTSGRPICRLSWTTLADNEIFERFDKITRSISHYYGGCPERKGLYQLQYIFRFSCAKTSACKHKSTIRTVWKKYGSNFVASSISLKKTESILPNSWRINPHGKNFWYLGITQINYLANLLHRLRNVQSSKK